MTPRTPEERERLYKLMWETDYPGGCRWDKVDDATQLLYVDQFTRRLERFPQLWDSLPPSPAEQARKEAEEARLADIEWLTIRIAGLTPPDFSWEASERLAEKLHEHGVGFMSARAAAGHPVLIAPKGEK